MYVEEKLRQHETNNGVNYEWLRSRANNNFSKEIKDSLKTFVKI